MIRARIAVIVVAAVLVASCSAPAPLPNDRFYRLADAPSSASAAVIEGTLAIGLPRASGIRRQRAILYSEDANHLELQRYHYHHWEAPPPQLVQQRLIDRMRGMADAVVEGPALGADYRIDSKIHRFDREVDGQSARAVVAVEFSVVSVHDEDQPVYEIQLMAKVPASNPSMTATAEAFTLAVDQVVTDFLSGWAAGSASTQ